MGFYFNRIYNPVYDFIVGQIAPYHRLQETCVSRLQLADGDKLLCAGIGTGNEVLRILDHTRNVHITGIDSSDTALHKAQKKARTQGAKIETRLMDVQSLDFPDETFDKVLCVHVADFVPDSGKASAELLRVLKRSGRFAITFPSAKEGLSLGILVITETVRQHTKNRKYYKIPIAVFTAILATVVYLPLTFRRARREYAKSELERLFSLVAPGHYSIEEFPTYQDFIVHGAK